MPASDRKSTRLNSSHDQISYAVFCLKKKNNVEGHRVGKLDGVLDGIEADVACIGLGHLLGGAVGDAEKARLLRHSSLFFFNDTATTEIYTLSLHDALPIYNATVTPFAVPPVRTAWSVVLVVL